MLTFPDPPWSIEVTLEDEPWEEAKNWPHRRNSLAFERRPTNLIFIVRHYGEEVFKVQTKPDDDTGHMYIKMIGEQLPTDLLLEHANRGAQALVQPKVLEIGRMFGKQRVYSELTEDCTCCEQGDPLHECSKSQRVCGHHCNHSWSHDECCWCGRSWDEGDDFPFPLEVPPNIIRGEE